MTHPYLRLLRLHQPIGIWLLLWPCWWSVALASGGKPSLALLLLFALGAVLMRSAGCIVNDMADREFDRQVERTKSRPLASGEISMRQASALLAVLLLASLLIALALGPEVMLWAALSLPLVVLYPFMKRISWWPQLFLGFTFNWGALMGWAAVRGTVEWPAFLLYAGGIFWTLGYDTIYAHQDKSDDARIGVKSTALRLGMKTRPALYGFYCLALLLWVAAGMAVQAAPTFYGLLSLAGLHFLWQIRTVRFDEPLSCKQTFFSNRTLGLLVFLAALAANPHIFFDIP